jgi:hypothetical protein
MKGKTSILAELWREKAFTRVQVKKLTKAQVDKCAAIFAAIPRDGGAMIVYGQGSAKRTAAAKSVRSKTAQGDTVLVVFAAAVRTEAGADGG